jgi:hypothetical protein
MERLPGTTRASASSLLLRVGLPAVGLSLFGLVEPHDEFLADWVRLQDDIEALAIVVREIRHHSPQLRAKGGTCLNVPSLHTLLYPIMCPFSIGQRPRRQHEYTSSIASTATGWISCGDRREVGA